MSPHDSSNVTSLSVCPQGTHCFVGTNSGRAYFYSLETSPPLYCAVVNSPSELCEVAWNTGTIIVAGDTPEGSGSLSFYQFSLGTEVKITPTLTGIEIGKGATCIKFSHSRGEVYIGYDTGVIGVVAFRHSTTKMICKIS